MNGLSLDIKNNSLLGVLRLRLPDHDSEFGDFRRIAGNLIHIPLKAESLNTRSSRDPSLTLVTNPAVT